MTATRGTAQRTLEWTMNNVGAGAQKIRRWDAKAGFAPGTAWCGIFLGGAMRAQGLPVPSGYAAAANWAGYGAAVRSLREAQPGDILVYGSHHVAMYLGGGRQIQGNNSNGTVGISAAGSGIGLGPITAIRRPPYRGTLSPNYNPVLQAVEAKMHGGTFEPVQETGESVANAAGDVASNLASQVVSDIFGLIHPEALMLNIALIGGGAFLVYYGAALMLGVKKPVATPAKAAAAGAVAPK